MRKENIRLRSRSIRVTAFVALIARTVDPDVKVDTFPT